jgi:hypothetical protein
MHIVIANTDRGFEVCVVDSEGRTLRRFTYHTIQSARTAAEAWRSAYGDCQVIDQTKALTRVTKEPQS